MRHEAGGEKMTGEMPGFSLHGSIIASTVLSNCRKKFLSTLATAKHEEKPAAGNENRQQQNNTKAMTMKKTNWIMLAACAVVLFIAAHGLVAWGGIKLSDKIGGWFPWIAGGTLMAFGLYHVIKHILGKGQGHSHFFGGHAHDGGEVERGPHNGFLVNLGHGFVEITIFETDCPPRFRLFFHDKHKQARSVPARATVTIETVRPDDTRQTFDFHAKGEYLESTTEIPEPHEFKALPGHREPSVRTMTLHVLSRSH
jgi:hypothetical protein